MRAERCPQVGRDRTALRSVLGSHVADFPFFSLIRETSRPRLESTLLALARPREVLVQSSATRGLALALGHRPRALGARLATPFMGKLTCRQRYGTPETDTAAHATHRSMPLHASADASTRQLWRGEAQQLSGKSTGGWWAQGMEVKAAMPLRGGV